MVLYLHGFRSSPGSRKATLIRNALAARGLAADYVCPQLPPSPRQAIDVALAAARLEEPQRLALIGSSLGGYYATWLAEKLGCRAVVLNPAVHPHRDLKDYLGEQAVYHSNATIEIKPEFLDELLALDTPAITRPERYFLLAATGDELIDYRLMVAKYAGCRQHIIEGSNHEMSDFANYLDEVLAFCNA
ncbi:MAG TPA: YqiA/YcfP family alpha/beta fold hydrolase [Burkholderiaceae bacterium]|nr:YqiA/YcfP family alpha/beta fold hydrolase [Burkholderiaceae bacterium]